MFTDKMYAQFPPDARQDFFRQFGIFKQRLKMQERSGGTTFKITIPKVVRRNTNTTNSGSIDFIMYNQEYGVMKSEDVNLTAPSYGKGDASVFTVPKPVVPTQPNISKKRDSIEEFFEPSELDSSVWQVIVLNSEIDPFVDIDNLERVIDNISNYLVFKKEITKNEGTISIPIQKIEAEEADVKRGDKLNIRALNLSKDSILPLRDQSTRRVTVTGSKEVRYFTYPSTAWKLQGWRNDDVVQFICKPAVLSI